MKKLKIALLIIFIANVVSAQTDAPTTPPPPQQVIVAGDPSNNVRWQSFRLGLEIEPILSWGKAKDNSIESSGAKFGYGGGIMGDFYFARNYALNIGVNFVYMGAGITYDSVETFKITPNNVTFPQQTKVDYKLQYVEIPIDFKLKTDQIGYLSYYGQFGAMLGFNIGSKADFSSSVSADNYSNVKLSGNVNVFNAGLLIGAGMEYNISGHTNLMVGLSYVNNFTNFTGNPANAAINHVSLNLGVFF